MPLDLKRLIIKRKHKDSMDFVIHYHAPDIGEEDVGSPAVNELYTLLKKNNVQTRKMMESLP